MKKHVGSVIFLSVFSALAVSCGAQSLPTASSLHSSKSKESVADWAILYYGLGDNSLSDDILDDVKEMDAFGSTKTISIAAQIDLWSEKTGEPDQRLLVKAKEGISTSRSKSQGLAHPVSTFRELDSGDPEVLRDFLSWGVKTLPAKHYAVILAGHGYGFSGQMRPSDGAKGAGRLAPFIKPISTPAVYRYFSIDQIPTAGAPGKSVLTTSELHDVLKGFRQADGSPLFEVVVADSCVSQTLENAYALKDVTKFYVASQETEYASGHDYGRTLLALENAEDAFDPLLRKPLPFDAEHFAEAVVDGYASQNLPGTHLSAIDVQKLEPVVETVHKMASEARPHVDLLRDWMRKTTYFGGVLAPKMWLDLETMARDWAVAGIVSHATSDELLGYLQGAGIGRGAIVSNQARGTGSVGRANGVSITFPGINSGGKVSERSVYWEIELELGILKSPVIDGSIAQLLDAIHCPPEFPCDVYGERWPK